MTGEWRGWWGQLIWSIPLIAAGWAAIATSGLPFVIRTPWEQSPEIDSDENKTSCCKTYLHLFISNSRRIHKIIWIPSISDSLIWQVIRILLLNVVVIWLLRRVVRMEGILEGWWRPVLVLSEVEIFIEPLNALTPVQIILVAAWWGGCFWTRMSSLEIQLHQFPEWVQPPAPVVLLPELLGGLVTGAGGGGGAGGCWWRGEGDTGGCGVGSVHGCGGAATGGYWQLVTGLTGSWCPVPVVAAPGPVPRWTLDTRRYLRSATGPPCGGAGGVGTWPPPVSHWCSVTHWHQHLAPCHHCDTFRCSFTRGSPGHPGQDIWLFVWRRAIGHGKRRG